MKNEEEQIVIQHCYSSLQELLKEKFKNM